MELSELDRRQRAEYRRELDELFERKKRQSRYKNGAEQLAALRDLFGSDDELEAFGLYIRRMREEARRPDGD